MTGFIVSLQGRSIALLSYRCSCYSVHLPKMSVCTFTAFNTCSCVHTCFVLFFGGRLNPCNQQKCGFRREAKRPDTKKGNVTQETNASPSEAGAPGPPPPPKVPRPTLFKPLMFTVGVGPPMFLLEWQKRCMQYWGLGPYGGIGCCLTPCQFTGCSFGAAAILQYETLKSRVQTAKDEEEAEKFLQVTL